MIKNATLAAVCFYRLLLQEWFVLSAIGRTPTRLSSDAESVQPQLELNPAPVMAKRNEVYELSTICVLALPIWAKVGNSGKAD
jgi:hypothetical protein